MPICRKCNSEMEEQGETEVAIAVGFVRPLATLSVIEKTIEKYGIIKPCPSRQTLIRMIEDGRFEGKQLSNLGWAIYEDSFLKWVDELQRPTKGEPADTPDALPQVQDGLADRRVN